ncbi:MAG: glycogen-binding domain-containing protein, partial [Meiothermus sp.]
MRRLLFWVGFLGAALAQNKVTFTYDPPYGLEVRSVSLRGSFNGWAEQPMQKTPEGTWQVTLELPPGKVVYKFFINGQWPRDMCEDATFGTPQVDLEAQACEDDGQGGRNAVRVVGQVAELHLPENPGLEHDPTNPRFLSIAAQRLSLRLWAERPLRRATLWAERPYPMH